MAPDLRDPPVAEPVEPDAPLPASVRRWRIAGVMAILVIALFWLWIFSGAAEKQNPDRVEDRVWAERAEATCARTMAGIEEHGRIAGRQDREARADAIDESTDDLRRMLDRLAAPPPAHASDREVVDPWLADWESLLGDRDRYANAVRRNPNARFLTTEKFGDSLDDVVKTFADVNDMPSCGPAGDVG